MVIFRDQSLFEYHETTDPKVRLVSKGKFVLSSFILSTVFIAVASSFLKDFYYIDPANTCLIKTRYSIHTENKNHIHQAIKTIRATMPSEYQTLCDFVDTISETYCIIASENGPIITYADSVGCYIKGTKTVFIQPQSTNKAVRDNEALADSLAKYAKHSEQFWLNKQ